MMLLTDRTRTTLADRRGFVMPMVLFALIIMSTMAVVAVNVSVSEHRSSRAVRTSLEALLASITGLNEIQANWNQLLAHVKIAFRNNRRAIRRPTELR